MRMRRIGMAGLVGLGMLSILLAAIAPNASAQSAESTITLSPVLERFNLAAGQAKAGTLTVINNGKTDYDFIVYARPYSVQDVTYAPNYSMTVPRADAYGWVQFDTTKYHLKAGERVEVRYAVRVPEKASPGGHYGVIFAEMQPPVTEGQSVVRKKRVGTILYATVQGDITQGAQFVRDDIASWQTQPPLHASVQLHNSGNSDFTAKTSLVVKDLFGRTKYSAVREASLFPGTTREIEMQWEDAPWFGLFNVELHATYLDETHDSRRYVLMMPRWLPVSVAVVVVGGVVYAAIRRRR